ncbi:PilZ domain-containing protein [Bradyrhizobium sp. LVM 105]|nr:PilZ domain-containing protein [Bradyrhizobium sp. LVM 105]
MKRSEMIERRKLERIEVDEVAYIFGDGASLRCRVINMSDQGAAIELPSRSYVNPTFKLMLDKDRSVRSCRLVWSSDNLIGVKFEF